MSEELPTIGAGWAGAIKYGAVVAGASVGVLAVLVFVEVVVLTPGIAILASVGGWAKAAPAEAAPARAEEGVGIDKLII